MDEEELAISKGSPLKLLSQEDLELDSVELLEQRILLLKKEIERSKDAISHKQSALNLANNIFR